MVEVAEWLHKQSASKREQENTLKTLYWELSLLEYLVSSLMILKTPSKQLK